MAALVWSAGVLARKLALATAAWGVGNYMRRSPEGNDAAHARAMCNWMRDGGWSLEGDKLLPTSARRSHSGYLTLFGALKSLRF